MHSRNLYIDFLCGKNCVRTLVLGLSLALPHPVAAEPPPGADPALAPWFHDLKQPGNGYGCCDMADCRPVDYRTVGDHYEAFIGDEWRAVPPDKVLKRTDNPTGSAIVCWTPYTGILCFVKGPET